MLQNSREVSIKQKTDQAAEYNHQDGADLEFPGADKGCQEYADTHDELFLAEPMFPLDNFFFDERHHGIASSDGEEAYLEKGAECFQIKIMVVLVSCRHWVLCRSAF